MKEKQLQVIKRLTGVLSVACCLALVAGRFSKEDIRQFALHTALLSVGIQQPDGGAAALSERLDRQPEVCAQPTTTAMDTAVSGQTTATSCGTSSTVTSSTTVNKVSVSGVVPPRNEKGGGVVSEQKMGLGSDFVQGVAIKNKSGKTFDLQKEIKILPSFRLNTPNKPQVLIVHTHTTEAYMPYYAGYYNATDSTRSKDESKNICTVGKTLADQLRTAGIQVIQDTTIHDSPKYTGAYSRSEETVKKNLAKYPSIQVVLDLHRDGIMLDDTTKVKPTVVIDGKKAAQVMIIVGVVGTKALPHPNWQDNFHFALQMQKALTAKYEGLMRPVSVVASRYNQHLSRGYLLMEVGSEGNTMEEAVYSATMLGKTMAQVLQSYK